MKALRDVLSEAALFRVAIGHFNISELVGFNAVVAAVRELQVPALVGVSEGERQFLGVAQAAALVKSVREEYGLPLFLNADHTHSIAKAEQAARAGFDEILFDGSSLPFEENIRETKRPSRPSSPLTLRLSSKGRSAISVAPRRFSRKFPKACSR